MPFAVDTAGISVQWLRYRAVLLCSLLAGSPAPTSRSPEYRLQPTTAGQARLHRARRIIFGKWHPLPAFGACLLFGLLDAIAIRLQGVRCRELAVPVQLFQALPYLLTVFLLAGFIGRAVAPRQPAFRV